MRLALLLLAVMTPLAAQQQHWTEQQANDWYQKQVWLVGANFIPKDAINQLEMWQADTYDAREMYRELGWAESIGMNTMRVFLHDLLWQQDQEGFRQRLDSFLTMAAKNRIRPILVLFDSCWDPSPRLGPQHPPIPGVHNSGWVQSPGARALADPDQIERLHAYTTGVIRAFANDPRILAWDLWNEPDNTNIPAYVASEPKNKVELVNKLLPQVFAWAREAKPIHPLTSGIWTGDWSSLETMSPTARIQITESDIITFHDYGWPESFEQHVRMLQQFHRPLICTEYMARGNGSTFDTILPLAKRLKVGAINWGFAQGKTQTNLPWDSWVRPYTVVQPPIWFHDIFHGDGTPYRQREIELIGELTGRTAPATAGR